MFAPRDLAISSQPAHQSDPLARIWLPSTPALAAPMLMMMKMNWAVSLSAGQCRAPPPASINILSGCAARRILKNYHHWPWRRMARPAISWPRECVCFGLVVVVVVVVIAGIQEGAAYGENRFIIDCNRCRLLSRVSATSLAAKRGPRRGQARWWGALADQRLCALGASEGRSARPAAAGLRLHCSALLDVRVASSSWPPGRPRIAPLNPRRALEGLPRPPVIQLAHCPGLRVPFTGTIWAGRQLFAHQSALYANDE